MSQETAPMVLKRNGTGRSVRRIRSAAPAGAALMGLAVLAACSTVPTLPPAPMEPEASTFTANLPPYRIQVGDVLEVRLLLNPELNEEVTVRPDGHISTTAIPDALAYGMTPADLADQLRRGEFITVGPSLSLSQALARAGGTRLSSDDTAVFVIRRGPGDKPQFLSTRWKAVRQGRDPEADIRLAPYDVVYVPKLGIAEVYQFYNQYLQQFVNPSFGFSYLLNPGNNVVTSTGAAAAPAAPVGR
jgi:polysaccharide export outer membrane protein